MSTRSTRGPRLASPIARFTLVVVLPTPPFMFTIAILTTLRPSFPSQLPCSVELLDYQLRVPHIRAVPLASIALYLRLRNFLFF